MIGHVDGFTLDGWQNNIIEIGTNQNIWSENNRGEDILDLVGIWIINQKRFDLKWGVSP